jgi:hypothetical protein
MCDKNFLTLCSVFVVLQKKYVTLMERYLPSQTNTIRPSITVATVRGVDSFLERGLKQK